ncbi:MAG: LytR C-terminal domain-containing protein [Gemmatimonadota bacterium]|nr:MAG: LytR C-terminal domain-containing protein [Gemmatimonadota bacterium]
MLLLAVAAGVWWLAPDSRTSTSFPIPGEGERIQVEVLNATRVSGLARTMTSRLRKAGIDVVYFGNAQESGLDSTLILVRRGDSSFVGRIREAIGGGKVLLSPDEELLLDASVLLGLDIAPEGRIDP